ncbi:MAG TPA: DNA-binding protein [Pseudomonadota bacterium]|nr:DNA-binding protein [Pseudomonadota bacterium]
MARGGLYRTDVEKARSALIAQGKHPSVDAVRVALGNTGSKTTIHRYLKEIDAEEGTDRKVAVSDALQDLVARLAAQLHAEADERIAHEKLACSTTVANARQAAEQQAGLAAGLQKDLGQLETTLAQERQDHAASRQLLIDASVRLSQFEERAAGLAKQVEAASAHAQSLEKKHEHAREALEHYRVSAKEQRDQDQRRHEHQVQELQLELRKAGETLTEKNHQVLQLNRDNARLTELVSQRDKDIVDLKSEVRGQQREIEELRPIATAHEVLQAKFAAEHQASAAFRSELEAARVEIRQAHQDQQRSDHEVIRLTARLAAVEESFARTARDSANVSTLSTTE